ncbi:MAG TPA: DUF1858 domain-containing protein [Verrucomicrobiae bacterium]|nr:DUF1858 domain-containing protein [Verrucomicrobiae bacterium]
MNLPINPETTVGALLEAYPEAESTLVDLAPAFARLRNPVVRRTVAKVATLEQAAKIGGVSLRTMIRKLRQATGNAGPDLAILETMEAKDDDSAWLAQGRVVEEIDAESMLERGVHPIGKIREAVAALAPGEVVVLRSGFRPEPLIETMRRAGAAVHSSVQGVAHCTRFGKRPAG